MNKDRRNSLRKLAQEASHQEWDEYHLHQGLRHLRRNCDWYGMDDDDEDEDWETIVPLKTVPVPVPVEEDAEFFSAACPKTVVEMLDYIDKLEERLKKHEH